MSKLEEARQIQQDAGWTTGKPKARNGCVCPLGALGMAYGLTFKSQSEEMEAYSGVSDEHKQDIALLGTAAYSRLKKRAFVRVPLQLWQEAIGVLSTNVWKYNDKKIKTNQQAVNLFTKAIEIRDSGVQILEEGVEL